MLAIVEIKSLNETNLCVGKLQASDWEKCFSQSDEDVLGQLPKDVNRTFVSQLKQFHFFWVRNDDRVNAAFQNAKGSDLGFWIFSDVFQIDASKIKKLSSSFIRQFKIFCFVVWIKKCMFVKLKDLK